MCNKMNTNNKNFEANLASKVTTSRVSNDRSRLNNVKSDEYSVYQSQNFNPIPRN